MSSVSKGFLHTWLTDSPPPFPRLLSMKNNPDNSGLCLCNSGVSYSKCHGKDHLTTDVRDKVSQWISTGVKNCILKSIIIGSFV